MQITTTDYAGDKIIIRVMSTCLGPNKSYKRPGNAWVPVHDMQRAKKSVHQAMDEMIRFVQSKPQR